MTEMTFIPASDKQIGFLSDLLLNREYDEDKKSEISDLIECGTLDKASASLYIDALVNSPRVPTVRSGMQELLASVPKSKYAIPTDELEEFELEDKFRGDISFFELKEFMGTLYVRQLHGAPGSFSRSAISAAGVRAVIALIQLDPYKYAKLFGTHYACCGSCGAELTDTRSRELQLGPECRKKFGF
jgi:hypothetical protein